MIPRNDPTHMAEPPPRTGQSTTLPALADTIRLAVVIAGPALRLVSLAALLMLMALLYRLGASADPDGIRLWGTTLTGLVALALMELPPRGSGSGDASATIRPTPAGARLQPRDVVTTDRVVLAPARHWASIVTLLAAACLALLFAAVAAGARASVAQVACAVIGLLLARAFVWVGERRAHAAGRRR